MNTAAVLTFMRADIERIPRFFCDFILAWSEMVSRVVWQGARDAVAVELDRRTFNARISWSGVVVRPYQLEGDNWHLMHTDGVHLNEIGLDIFLSGLQDGVEQALYLLGAGRSSM